MLDYRPDYISMAHMSSRIWTPVLAYDDLMLFGENYRGSVKDSYCQLIPMDKFRAEFMGRQFGLIPVIALQLEKQYWSQEKPIRGLFTLAQLHDTFIWTRGMTHVTDYIRNVTTLCQNLHEDAEFIPHFDKGHQPALMRDVMVMPTARTRTSCFVGNVRPGTPRSLSLTFAYRVNSQSAIDHVAAVN